MGNDRLTAIALSAPSSPLEHPIREFPSPVSLRQAAHHRLSSGRPVSQLRVGPLTEEAREALADLL